MLTQERYDKIIRTVEDTAEARSGSYFEEPPEPADVAKRAFGAAGWPAVDAKTANSIFNFMTGMTFKQYLDSRIMMRAYRELLAQESFDPSALINIVGVSSDSALYKKFKKEFGLSPKDAFEKKDARLYAPPTYWDSLSDAKQSGFEKVSAEKEIRLIPVETVREIYKTDKRPYRVTAVFLAIIIAAAGLAYRHLLLKPWENDYACFTLTTEDGISVSTLDSRTSFSIQPYRGRIISRDEDGPGSASKIRVRGNSISWTDVKSGLSYRGTMYNDRSIICRIYKDGSPQDEQLRLVPESGFEDWKASWDGYYEVFESRDDFYSPSDHSVRIDLENSYFILASITGDDVYVGRITYCGPEHLVFSLPELVPDAFLQCDLTGRDSFSVTYLNSEEPLFKCFRVKD